MPRPGVGRAATRFLVGVVVTVALTGCGTPSNLDGQEQVAFARACASLVERNLSDHKPPRTAQLGSDDLNLDDPSSFYAVLGRIRGPATFNLHDPKHNADTARQPLDDCSPKPRLTPSALGTTTATTTTTTTMPGS